MTYEKHKTAAAEAERGRTNNVLDHRKASGFADPEERLACKRIDAWAEDRRELEAERG